jgi:hypothetical protein
MKQANSQTVGDDPPLDEAKDAVPNLIELDRGQDHPDEGRGYGRQSPGRTDN